MRKVPLKGKPNFANLSDSKVKQYADVVNDMIGAYSEFPECVRLLKTMWKDLSNEYVDRITDDLPDECMTMPKRKRITLKRSVKLDI